MNVNAEPPERRKRRSVVAVSWHSEQSAVMSSALTSASEGYSNAQWWPSVAVLWPQYWHTPLLRARASALAARYWGP